MKYHSQLLQHRYGFLPLIFKSGKQCILGLDNYIRTSNINGVRGAGMFDVGLTTGLLPFEKFQGEIGVDYLYMGDSNYDDHPIYFNAKLDFPKVHCLKALRQLLLEHIILD